MNAVRFVYALSLLAAVPACAVDNSALPPPEDGGVDSTSGDSGAPDGSTPDGARPDSATAPDGSLPDTGQPDTSVEDSGLPCTGWAPVHFDPCAIPASEMTLVISGASNFDTDTGVLTVAGAPVSVETEVIAQGGTDARLISVGELTVSSGASLRVLGSLPLIVASWGTITVDGEIVANSDRGGNSGAGANHSSCTGAGAGEAGDSGSGGGGGGGFGGRGGHGGQADLNGGGILDGGPGGPAVAAPTIVRGGCPGANSGVGYGSVSGQGGAGGGAVQLSARGSIAIAGRVVAGGAGGTGGPDSSAAGGGAGGSGGYIGLEGASVTVTGILAANGGGGGGGTDLSRTGGNGENGRPTTMRAPGGAGASDVATDGGGGGAGSDADGLDVSGVLNGGGGGGGGGVGFVLVRSPAYDAAGAVVSPPAITVP